MAQNPVIQLLILNQVGAKNIRGKTEILVFIQTYAMMELNGSQY